ncbi:DUF6415 family natural product biosynthesis protein [Streptomyces sp. NPDC002990]
MTRFWTSPSSASPSPSSSNPATLLRPLRCLWFAWLSGHLNLLLDVIGTGPAADPAVAGDDQLVAEAVADTRRVLEAGLPTGADQAYVRLQELARTCRFLLGLAHDRAVNGRPHTQPH